MGTPRQVGLATGTALTVVVRLSGVAFGLVTSIAVARLLGPAGKGELAAMGAVVALATQATTLGLPGAIAQFVARHPEQARRVSHAAVAAAVGFGLVAALLVVMLHRLYPPLFGALVDWPLYLYLLAIPFALLVQFGQNILLGLQDVTGYNAVEAVTRLAAVLFLPALVWLYPTTASAVTATVLVQGLASLAGLWRLCRVLPPTEPGSALPVRALLGQSLRFFISSGLVYALLRFDVLILNAYTSAEQVGWYSTAAQAVDLLLVLPASIGLVLMPAVSRRPEEGHKLTAQIVRTTVLLQGMACLAAYLVAPWLITLVFGARFAPAAGLLRWLLPGAFAFGIVTPLTQSLAGYGMPWRAVLVWVPPLLLNLFLNFALVPRYGAVAAAAASSAAYIVALAAHLFGYRQRTHLRFADFLPRPAETWRLGRELAARLRSHD